MSKYFNNISEAIKSMTAGMKMTLGYLMQATQSRKPIGIADETYFDQDKGTVTLQYPHESFPVPDNGRYRLHNEIDDCIVCDKCAKVCPVDCIDIDPIKATETFGETSDGTPKRIYAAKFDIDMAKCCFCGLCTTVCPTECLTMTKVYDFSEFNVEDHNYSFANMSLVDIAIKRKEAEEADAKRQAAKAAMAKPAAAPEREDAAESVKPKSSFKPRVAKPAINKTDDSPQSERTSKAKPVLRPKPVVDKPKAEVETDDAKKPTKPIFRTKPMVKPVVKTEGEEKKESTDDSASEPAKPVFRPKVKPVVKKKEDSEGSSIEKTDTAKPIKPVFRPKVKPVIKKKEASEDSEAIDSAEAKPKPVKPVFKPKVKPVIKTGDEEKKEIDEASVKKPAKLARPIVKRKPTDDGDVS